MNLSDDDLLRAYLEANPAHHRTVERWPVQGELEVHLSVASTLPPAHVSSSILAIVLDADLRVLFLHPDTPNGSIAQLLIGGRPEGEERPEETVVREVGEETGWRVDPIKLIGFRHFFHLEPFNPKSDRPYPSFIQPIFAAHAVTFDPKLILEADRIPAEFLEYSVAERMTEPGQRPLLVAAVDAMR